MFECLSLHFNLVRQCCLTQQNPNRNVVFKHHSIAVPLDDNTCFPVFIDDEASENCMKKVVILGKMHHFYICKDDLVTYLPERFEGMTKEEIEALSLQEYEQLEENWKNPWRATTELAE